MDNLPYEVISNIILYSCTDIIHNLRLVNSVFHRICNDEYVLKQKYQYEYGQIKIPCTLTYKQLYNDISINRIKLTPVYFYDYNLGITWIHINDTVKCILQKVKAVFSQSPYYSITCDFSMIDTDHHVTECIATFCPYTTAEIFWKKLYGFSIKKLPTW